MNDIEKLRSKLADLELGSKIKAVMPKSSGWLSRKLMVVLAVIGVLIYLGKDNVSAIIAGVITLGMTYLIVQGANDFAHTLADAWVRGKLVDGMAKDGLTKDEVEEIESQVPPKA